MDLSFYEKEADNANYIYFEKYVISDENKLYMLPHFHDSIEFVFVVKGECRIRINTQEMIVRAGQVSFTRPFELHLYRPEKGAVYYVVLMSSRYLGEYDFTKKAFPSFMEPNEKFEKILQFLDFSCSVWDNQNACLKKGFAEMLLGLMFSIYALLAVKEAKATQAFIEIMKYINQNFKKDLTLHKLADKFGYSKTYLSELFNEFTGMKLRDYINRRRINEFYKNRIDHPEIPVCRLAEEAGFNSLNTFYRVLHKYSENPNF